MAPGQTIYMEDLPPELMEKSTSLSAAADASGDWQTNLSQWTTRQLIEGKRNVAKRAIAEAERILIQAALRHTRGRRQDAARLLGYGRNTLTRKISELKLEENETQRL
jgi:two-component system nitrogen regulation response regulator GlnG